MFKIWHSSEPDPPSPGGSYNFSPEVRDVLARGRDAAITLGHRHVDTRHLLLGMLDVPQSEGARALAALGADADELRRLLKFAASDGGRVLALGSEMPYSNDAKRALELAMEERMRAGTGMVTSRHLLAGIARQEKEVAARVLAELGVTLDALRGAESATAAALGIRIDDGADRSIYEQIVAQVQEAAATGRIAAGQRLPSVRALADELDIAPGTVARAYAELERRRVVVTDGARGTRVAERPPAGEPARMDELAGLIRPAVVSAYHQGARAADLRAALERAMADIYPPDDDPPAASPVVVPG